MDILDVGSEAGALDSQEEQILASFTGRLMEIAASSLRRDTGTSATAAFNAMRVPAVVLDGNGFVIEVNAVAEGVFGTDIKIKDRRLFMRDAASRALFNDAIEHLKGPGEFNSLDLEPIIVPRTDKLPVIVRMWPFDASGHGQAGRMLLTLNALGPRPGPSAAIIAKTFRLTPSEAKLACIIARGAPPDIAARELKISRETARNQLKSVFAKTDTHRQSELVALLSQVG